MAAYLDLATNIGFSALIPRRVAGKRKIWKETGLGDLRQPRKMAVTPPPPHTHTITVSLYSWQGIQNSFLSAEDQRHTQGLGDGANTSLLFFLGDLLPCRCPDHHEGVS